MDELLEHAQTGVSAGEFVRWWSSIEPGLLTIARRLVGAQELAQDLVQDVAVIALRDTARFPDAARFSSWAHKRLYGMGLDVLTARKKWPLLQIKEDLLLTESPPQEEGFSVKRLLDSIERLPERQREVMHRAIRGDDTEEIASALGISSATVRSLRRLARDRLVQILEELDSRGRASRPPGSRSPNNEGVEATPKGVMS